MAELIVQRGGAEANAPVLNVQAPARTTSGIGIQLMGPQAGGGAAVVQQVQQPQLQAQTLFPPMAPQPPPPMMMTVPPVPPPASRPPPPRRLAPRPLPPMRRMPARYMDDEDDDDDNESAIEEFANPSKKKAAEDFDDYGDDDDDDGGGGPGGDDSGPEDSEYGDGGGGGGGGPPPVDHNIPSEGYDNLEEEKADIMFKLGRLKRQGMKGLRQFDVYSDIREMRAELTRIKTELSVDGSIKTQRQILMAIVSSMEFLNKRYDPFDLQLNGWSEQVHENINDYDDVFERLYFKYRNKVSAPPELQLLLMVGGSAMMFHMTNALFKNSMMPKMQASPETMQKVMAAFQPQQQQPQQQQQQQPGAGPGAGPGPGPGARREMSGPMPGMDMGALLGGGMPPLAMPQVPLFGGNMGRPAASSRARDIQELPHPSETAKKAAKGRRKPSKVVAESSDDDDDSGSEPASDRLSDALSDLESVPSDLESLSSYGGGKRGAEAATRNVTVSGRGRGRGGGRGKKIVTI